jgi:signal transduction histidine kinase
MFALPGSGEIFGDLENSGFEMPKFQVTHCAYFSQGYLVFITYGQVSEAHDIFKRFAKVFEQTYTRFLDLQKAEAQAREAQIETALERVRAKAMSMHASHELKEVVHELRKQMGLLGQKDLETCVIHLHDESPDFIHSWAAIKPPETESEILESTARVPKKGLLIIEEALEAYTANRQDYIMINEGKKLQQWFSFLKQESPEGYRKLAESVKGRIENLRAFWSFADFSGGSLLMVTMDEPDDQTRGLLRRFANVFGLAYRRFADLKQAEAQAREAQIEAALERVRSKAMAMHNSADLPSTAIIAFTELKKLGFVPIRCGISIQNKENRKNLLYSATTSGEGDTLSLVGWAILDNHPVLSEVYDQWMKGEDCFPELKGELLRTYYEQVRNSFDVPVEQTLIEQYGYFISFTHGLFYGWCEQPVTEDEKKLLKRFAAVIDLTFKRYFDLQKAEAQAREAQVEAALEKVRSRTLAMQKSDELAGTAAVLFQQLISLGIAPNRLYIILTEENSYEMEAWVTDEDGSKVSMGFTGNYQKNQSLQKMYEGWKQQKKSLVIDMQGEELQSYFHYLHDELKVPFKGGLEQKRRIQHLAYFSHGMIGMASPEEQPAETLQLMERFASVFNLTFTRFNDLKIAEAHAMQAEQDLIAIKEAKQKAEEALTELQATQKQLVQSEKMASLGELTAGIAHEIQNPLNFVNNFSEVSADLLQELVEEMEKGNTQDAKEIAQDLVNNLQKIHHHGERAASIVKGMLQHSRSSSGQKEPTDINALCDEYLRLAYHGLRAKDKSFNAKFETSFDDSIGKISVMPQELGRVMLNLINNAFYATGERKNYNEPGYEPCVTVSSERVADKIIIKVKDNGTGIPPQAVDKIFQPFFTTKPTGQGTGLGLSLSYDIVTKAHGGELKVETKDGEGTTFIIHLPVVRITD